MFLWFKFDFRFLSKPKLAMWLIRLNFWRINYRLRSQANLFLLIIFTFWYIRIFSYLRVWCNCYFFIMKTFCSKCGLFWLGFPRKFCTSYFIFVVLLHRWFCNKTDRQRKRINTSLGLYLIYLELDAGQQPLVPYTSIDR